MTNLANLADLPDSSLLQGNTQQVLVWVVLALIALWSSTSFYFISRIKDWEDKYDALLEKTLKFAVRSKTIVDSITQKEESDAE